MAVVKFKLIIAYDGTAYQGWQVQKTGTGVQQKVETALAKLFPSRPRLHSSSRTDTGVHALGMVAHFEVPSAEYNMSSRKLALALNAWLPEDIRLVAAARARKDFHGMLEEGIYLAPSQFEAGFISTAHSAADIEQTCAAARKLFKAL